jgi:MFS family permease
MGWLVYELSGSAMDLGILGAAAAIPNVAVSLFGGALADRFDQRRIMILTTSLFAGLLLVLALLDFTGVVTVWQVWLIAGLIALIQGIDWPARQSLYPHLIERDGMLSAVALNSFLWQSTRMLMPALGGLLIAIADTWLIFKLSAIGFLYMLYVIVGLRVELPIERSESTLRQVATGIRFILETPVFKWLIALSFSTMFFVWAYMQLMPVYADTLGAGETGYGMLLSATGLGSVIGTLVIGAFPAEKRLGTVILSGALTSALVMYGFAAMLLVPSYYGALAFAMLGSACSAAFMINALTVLQLEVPDTLRGRVMGIHAMTYSLMPLGGLLLGALTDRIGATAALSASVSVFLVILLIISVTQPVLRRLDGRIVQREVPA